MYKYKQSEQQSNIPEPYTAIAKILVEKYGMNVKNKNNKLHAIDDKIRMIVSFDKHVKGPCRWHIIVAAAGAFENFGKNTSTDIRFWHKEDVLGYLAEESNMHEIYIAAFTKLSGKASALMKQNRKLKKELNMAKNQEPSK